MLLRKVWLNILWVRTPAEYSDIGIVAYEIKSFPERTINKWKQSEPSELNLKDGLDNFAKQKARGKHL